MTLGTDGYTQIEYGTGATKVTIVNCTTLKFHQEYVKDASGLEDIFSRFTIRVSGYLLAQPIANTQILPNKGVLPGGTATMQTAGSQNVLLRHLLEMPRQHFVMTLGAGGPNPTILLKAVPFTSASEPLTYDYDCQGGPQPKELDVVNVVGNTAVKVEWEVVVCLVPNCPSASANAGDTQRSNGILSNKWTSADDIDENFYIRSRVFVGELKLANPLVNPHDFRTLALPGIQPGMRLKGMSFKAAENCLSLQYTITHEEVTVTAPYPATSIKIQHKTHVSEYNLEVTQTLSITLKGDREVNKKELITLAHQIASYKLRFADLFPVGGISKMARLRHTDVIDESGTNQDNQITLIFHLSHIPIEGEAIVNTSALNRISEYIGRKINPETFPGLIYDNDRSRGNRIGEKPEATGIIPVVGALASHLQAICTQDHSMTRAYLSREEIDGLYESFGPYPALPPLDVTVYDELPELPDSTFNASNSDGMYQTYEIDSQYQSNPLIFQAPLSRPVIPYVPGGGSPTPQPQPTPVPLTDSPSSAVGDQSVFIQMGAPQWKRIVRILAQRHGKPPRLAEPARSFRDEQGVLNVLISPGSHILLTEPQRSVGDNSRDYAVRAEYHYGLSKAPSNLKTGIPDTDLVQSPAVIAAGQGPYSFTMASIFSSDHKVG